MENLSSKRLGGVQLHWVEKGQGPAILFVPGSNGDYRAWLNQVNAFSNRYQAISMSLRRGALLSKKHHHSRNGRKSLKPS